MPVHARCRTNTLTARQTGTACGKHCTEDKKTISPLKQNDIIGVAKIKKKI